MKRISLKAVVLCCVAQYLKNHLQFIVASLYLILGYVCFILYILCASQINFVPVQPVLVFYALFPDKDTALWHSVLFMAHFELTPQPNELQLAS